MSDLKKFIERMMAASALIGLSTSSGCSSSHERSDLPHSGDVSVQDASDVSLVDAARDVGVDSADRCAPRVIRPNSCSPRIEYPCGIPGLQANGSVERSRCQELCIGATSSFGCYAESPTLLNCTNCGVGRRPHGYQETKAVALDAIGMWFSEVAMLELAAVDAFQILHDDLARFGAPLALRERALEGKADEIRHAKTMRIFAEGAGASVPEIRVLPLPERSFFEVALENAVEGCVRENFGAFQASHQATHAQDRMFAGAMIDIAHEETNHAQLSWEIHAWAMPLLSPDQQRQVREAMQTEVDGLIKSTQDQITTDLDHALGLPPREAMLLCLSEISGHTKGRLA